MLPNKLYPINQLVVDYMQKRSLERKALVRALGYTHIEKAFRSFDDAVKNNRVEGLEFLRRRIHNVLQIPVGEIEIAWQKTREILHEHKLAADAAAEKAAAEEASLRIPERELMADNFLLLLKNTDIINQIPEYFFCLPGPCYLSIAYIGGGPLYLGTLLEIWQRELVLNTCEACGGRLFLQGAGGSPLNGSHSCWGFCSECHKLQSWRHPDTFVSLALPIREMIQANKPAPLLNQGEQNRGFTFKEGVVEENEPDELLAEGVQSRTILQLLWELGDETLKKQLEEKYSHIPDIEFNVTDPNKFGWMKIGNKKISGSAWFD